MDERRPARCVHSERYVSASNLFTCSSTSSRRSSSRVIPALGLGQRSTIGSHELLQLIASSITLPPNFMLYVTRRESWRSGGINGIAPSAIFDESGNVVASGTDRYKSEVARDIEAGMKYNARVVDVPFPVYISAYSMASRTSSAFCSPIIPSPRSRMRTARR